MTSEFVARLNCWHCRWHNPESADLLWTPQLRPSWTRYGFPYIQWD